MDGRSLLAKLVTPPPGFESVGSDQALICCGWLSRNCVQQIGWLFAYNRRSHRRTSHHITARGHLGALPSRHRLHHVADELLHRLAERALQFVGLFLVAARLAGGRTEALTHLFHG